MATAMWWLLALVGAAEPPRYLLWTVTTPPEVNYMVLPPAAPSPQVLISTSECGGGLQAPTGIAVLQKQTEKLVFVYVADPRKGVMEYQVVFTNGQLACAGTGRMIPGTAGATWVAVDHVGDVFFTDGRDVKAVKQSPEARLLKPFRPTFLPAVQLYGTDSSSRPSAVNKPSGLTADGFSVFWANSAEGLQYGSVNKGPESPDVDQGPLPIAQVAKNADKVRAVCLTQNNIYFTAEDNVLYGVKKMGGAVATMSTGMLSPQGCAWDGDGTVYVADSEKKTLVSFAGNMRSIGPTKLTELAVLPSAPHDLAVVQAPLDYVQSAFAGLVVSLLGLLAL